ncbi:MAG: Ig-like domain-containing protein [Anaerolineales bacterium]|nr:Ig-like domain-containing protein [Anaerolineales bacterium]
MPPIFTERSPARRTVWRLGRRLPLLLVGIIAALWATAALAAPADGAAGSQEPAAFITPSACTITGVLTWEDPADGPAVTVFFARPNQPSLGVLTPVGTWVANGQTKYGFCLNAAQDVVDDTYCLDSAITDWRIAYLLSFYPPDPANRLIQAGRQAAMWHYTNDLNIKQTDPSNQGPAEDAIILQVYNDILAEVDAFGDTPPPIFNAGPLLLSIAPASATNVLPAESSHPFTVTLTNGGAPLSGYTVNVVTDFGALNAASGVTDANGQANFTISSNSTGTANIGASAEVVLPGANQFLSVANPTREQPLGIGDPVTVTASGAATKTWVTEDQPGRIQVTKQVIGDVTPWSFTFTLDGADPKVATNTAPTVAWENLTPNQTYTLAEVDPGPDWTQGEFVCSVDGQPVGDAQPGIAGFQVLVEPGASVACTFDNTAVVEPGRIQVTKQVIGDVTTPWSFTFTLDGADPRVATNTAPTVSWEDLTPNQTYTLAGGGSGCDWTPGEFACAVGGDPVSDADSGTAGFQVLVQPGASVVCTFDNTAVVQPGRIQVTKQVIGDVTPWSFTFTLDGADPKEATNLAPTVSWEDLTPNQTYTLAEVDPGPDWVAGEFVCAVGGDPVSDADPGAAGFQVLVQPGASVVCTFDNTAVVDPGRIQVTKQVIGDVTPWSFTFTLDGADPKVATNVAPTVSWEDLTPNQTYTLAEVDPGPDWVAGEFACAVGGDPVGDADPGAAGFQVLVQPGASVVCTFDNTAVIQPARIQVTKSISGSNILTWTFTFTLNGGDPKQATNAAPTVAWEDLTPNETYTLAEVNPGAQWTPGPFVCSVNGNPLNDADPEAAGFQVLVRPGDNVVCTIRNTRTGGTALDPAKEPGAFAALIYLGEIRR